MILGWLRDIWERLLASRREKKMCETEEEEKMCKEKEEEEVVLGDIWGSLASGLVVPPAGCRPKLHSLLHLKLNPFPMPVPLILKFLMPVPIILKISNSDMR